MKLSPTIALLVALASSVAAYGQFPSSAQLGPPPGDPPLVRETMPPQPSRFHVWIDGFWAPFGDDYTWYNGYWTVPPFYGTRWVPPRYDARYDRFYFGFWDGERIRRYREYRPNRYKGSEYVTSDDRYDGLTHR